LLLHFGLKIFHERCFVIVLDGCTCGSKKHPIFFNHVVDTYDFLFAHGPGKLIKAYKFRPQGATILSVIN